MDFKRYKQLKANMFPIDEASGLIIPRYEGDINIKYMNPLVLAYVGDAYYHLFVRTQLLSFENTNVRLLNDISMLFVSATWQARAYEKIAAHLNEDEQAIFKRAKNTKSHAPRVASVKDYHMSTGIEAVMGYLHLSKNMERLDEICSLQFQAMMELYNQQIK